MNTIGRENENQSDCLLTQMVGKLSDGYMLFTAGCRLQDWSASIVDFYPILEGHLTAGVERDALLQQCMNQLAVQNLPEHLDPAASNRHTNSDSTVEALRDFVHHLADGRWVRVRPVTLAEGKTLFAWFDITGIREEHQALQQSEGKFRQFARLASNWFWELDQDLNYRYHSSHHALLSDRDPTDLVGKSRIDNLRGGLVHDDQLEEHNRALLAHDDVNVILTWDHGQGRKSFSHVLAQPRFDKNGLFLGYIGCGKDVSLACRLRDDLAHQATHDHLTGLANRHAFEEKLEWVLRNRFNGARSIGFTGYCVVAIDLDHFKLVNDAAGHIAGDELLKEISQILGAGLGPHGLVARLGGDEFGACLKLSPSDALDQLHQVIETIATHRFHWNNRKFSIGASAGIALITDKSIDSSCLLNNADAACYSAKRLGRNRAELYSPENHFQALQAEEMKLINVLKSAMDNDRLRLFLQPIVAIDGPGEVEKHECLLRVLDENHEYVPIGLLIPIAERHDLMQVIDLWVVRKAITYLSAFAQNGFNVNLSVNLSGKTLSCTSSLDQIQKIVHDESHAPDSLCFEITETAAIQSLETVVSFIDSMRDMGCSFALDDFGRGMSSYSYMKSLKVDYLKIDGSFVKEIVDDPSSKAIVKSINTLSHEMGMRTVAEYVENDAIASILIDLDVDFLQGYGLGRPVDADKVLASRLNSMKKTGT